MFCIRVAQMCNASNFCQFNDLLYTYDFHYWAENYDFQREESDKRDASANSYLISQIVTSSENVLMKMIFIIVKGRAYSIECAWT